MTWRNGHFRFASHSDHRTRLLYHFIDEREQRRGKRQSERLGCFYINDQIKFRGHLDRDGRSILKAVEHAWVAQIGWPKGFGRVIPYRIEATEVTHEFSYPRP